MDDGLSRNRDPRPWFALLPGGYRKAPNAEATPSSMFPASPPRATAAW
jgi:hypothetical protein